MNDILSYYCRDVRASSDYTKLKIKIHREKTIFTHAILLTNNSTHKFFKTFQTAYCVSVMVLAQVNFSLYIGIGGGIVPNCCVISTTRLVCVLCIIICKYTYTFKSHSEDDYRLLTQGLHEG